MAVISIYSFIETDSGHQRMDKIIVISSLIFQNDDRFELKQTKAIVPQSVWIYPVSPVCI